VYDPKVVTEPSVHNTLLKTSRHDSKVVLPLLLRDRDVKN